MSEQQFENHEAEEAETGEGGDTTIQVDSSKPEGDADKQVDVAGELQATKDKYLRLFAEFENFRRRTAKENFELVVNANAKLIGKLTEVLDNFNLAFDPKHKAGKIEDLEKGFRLIHNRFKNILEEEGLEEVNPVGEEFDPNIHDAVMQQPSEKAPENHIIEVLQKGYKVKSKHLNHAKVIVSTGKPGQG